MIVNSSRFLVLDKKIPQVQVNNPDVLDVMPILPTQVQISARRTGVTQVNLWGEDKRIYTVTVVVLGDAAELTETLRILFPRASLTIVPINGNSAIISGYADQQDEVPKIVSVASKYFPDVINNMKVSGVQQATLHVKVYEISRSKLRSMGFDWASISSNGNLVMSGVNGLLTTAAGAAPPAALGRPPAAPDNTFKFNIGTVNAFYGVLSASPGQSWQVALGTGPRDHQRPACLHAGGRYYKLPDDQRFDRTHHRLVALRHAIGFRAHRAGQRPDAH